MGTILLLLVLVGAWVGLGAWWLSGRQTERPVDSIGSFRRQLGTLERRNPALVPPANRMRVARPRPMGPVGPAYRPGMGRAIVAARTHTMAMAGRREAAQRRRRDVFLGLVSVGGLTFLGGFVPALRMLWVACAIDVILLGCYCTLLVRMRNLALEREMKIRYLSTARERQDRLAAARPRTVAAGAMRRQAN